MKYIQSTRRPNERTNERTNQRTSKPTNKLTNESTYRYIKSHAWQWLEKFPPRFSSLCLAMAVACRWHTQPTADWLAGWLASQTTLREPKLLNPESSLLNGLRVSRREPICALVKVAPLIRTTLAWQSQSSHKSVVGLLAAASLILSVQNAPLFTSC